MWRPRNWDHPPKRRDHPAAIFFDQHQSLKTFRWRPGNFRAFSERMGQRNAEDGPVQMMPITHELLLQYVGTSREIITLYMNQFRREGYLDYSRKKGILVYGDALRDWLRQQAA